jgi:RNA polymerase sigma-70 factor (ECF subfamily)
VSIEERFPTILAAARAGAEWALAELYRELHPRVLRYVRALEPSEAEDLASEIWLDVARGLGRFEGDDRAFRAWAFTIARRRLVDLRRQRARRPAIATPVERLAERGGIGDVEEEAMAGLTTEAAIARIATLPPDRPRWSSSGSSLTSACGRWRRSRGSVPGPCACSSTGP